MQHSQDQPCSIYPFVERINLVLISNLLPKSISILNLALKYVIIPLKINIIFYQIFHFKMLLRIMKFKVIYKTNFVSYPILH